MAIITPKSIKYELFPVTERRGVVNTLGPLKVVMGDTVVNNVNDIVRLTPEMKGNNYVSFSHIYVSFDGSMLLSDSKVVLAKESDETVLADLIPAASANASPQVKVDLANVVNKAARKVFEDRYVPCFVGIQYPTARGAGFIATKTAIVSIGFSIHNSA